MISPTTLQRPIRAALPGLTLAATAAASAAYPLPGTGSVLRIVNEGPSPVFIGVGGKNVAAALPTAIANEPVSDRCACVLPGADVTFSRDPTSETHISTICRAAGSATLSVYTGEGK